MTLTLNSKALDEALALGQRIAPSAGNLPVLTCVHIETEWEDKVKLSFDSVNSRLEILIDGKCDNRVEFLAPIRHLKASLRADEAVLSVDSGWLTVKSGGTSKLGSLAVSEFPKAWPKVGRHSIDPSEFISALRVASACCADQSHANSNYMNIYHDASLGRLVGTNGGTCAYAPCAMLTNEVFLLPFEHGKQILDIFSGEQELFIGSESKIFGVHSKEKSFYCKLSEGSYPNYRMAFAESGTSATVERGDLLSALKGLLGFANSFGRVMIEPKSGEWEITAASGESGDGNSSAISIPVTESRAGESFYIQAHRIAKMLSAWSCDTLNVTKTDSTLIFKPQGLESPYGVAMLMRK